jgi:hypothetical protein
LAHRPVVRPEFEPLLGQRDGFVQLAGVPVVREQRHEDVDIGGMPRVRFYQDPDGELDLARRVQCDSVDVNVARVIRTGFGRGSELRDRFFESILADEE